MPWEAQAHGAWYHIAFMGEANSHIPGLMGLISAAVAPVVLISAVAIFFSALTSKHSHLADQIRQLTAEFRRADTSDARRLAIERQMSIFERRMDALWISTLLLSLSLLSFVCTILFVIGSQRTAGLGILGIASMLCGLGFLLTGVVAELMEIALARASLRCEIVDVDATIHCEGCGAPVTSSIQPTTTRAPASAKL